MDTTIVSYNSRGFPRNDIQLNSNPFVSKIVNNSDVSFACFQETFYTKQDLSFLNNIHPNFHGVGAATTDEKLGFIQGHPPGGVAILWRKQYDSIVKPLIFSYDYSIGHFKVSRAVISRYPKQGNLRCPVRPVHAI